MKIDPAEAPPPPLSRTATLLRLAGIGATLALLGGGFAYAAGWLAPGRLSPDRIIHALTPPGVDPTGHRRNHAKGICFTGTFEASGAGIRLSTAPMLAAGRYPVTGRFAIATPNSGAPDASGRVRSMAIRITAPDGQEWRTGMNSMPVFPFSTPEAFYGQLEAARVDPTTGRPDPQAMPRFFASHPEAAPFLAWAGSAPWTLSYADQGYNSLNAFLFTDASGATRAVRWSMEATIEPTPVPQQELAAHGPDFLSADLTTRLRSGPLRWRLVATVAAPGDPVEDPTKAWPAGREQVELGTLTVEQDQPEANGPCRDINYDPLVLPTGMAPSADRILLARSPAYANSFRRREAEQGGGP